jgi:hypothetical protein
MRARFRIRNAAGQQATTSNLSATSITAPAATNSGNEEMSDEDEARLEDQLKTSKRPRHYLQAHPRSQRQHHQHR